MAAHAKINFDRDYFVCFIPGTSDAAVYTDEDEARQCCRDYPQYVCMKVNPVEGWSQIVTDDFAERDLADTRLAGSLARHEASYRRPV